MIWKLQDSTLSPALLLILLGTLLRFVDAKDETNDNVTFPVAVEEELERVFKEGDHVYEEIHESLFPLEPTDYAGFFLCFLGLVLAAGGGIGGGGILIPIYILVMRFSPKHAIPLSNVTVLGGALANLILNVRQRHPLADRPLIDWQLLLIMEPVTIAGAVVGTWINSMLSETVIVIMLIVLLTLTARKTLSKAIQMYRKETREIRNREKLASANELSCLVVKGESIHSDGMPVNDELTQILNEERRAPLGAIIVIVALFFFVLVINLAKGGGAYVSPLGITCGSATFWTANALILLSVAVVTLFVRSWLTRRYEMKDRVGYKYVEGDIHWDSRTTLVYPAICFLAGLFAGMFGIGGGIVKGPLMLQMGVHPAVASATSATMILFTSTTATTSYVVFGLLVPEYAIVCFSFGFVSTLFGQILLAYLMRMHARNSYIAFSIGVVVLVSALLMTMQSIVSMVEGEHHKSNGLCGVDT